MKAGTITKALLFATLLGFMQYSCPVLATEPTVRENISAVARNGEVIIGVEGYDCTSAQSDLLKIVNDERYEACNNGKTPDPRNTSRMLTPSDYVPIKLGVACTKAAMIRAAEGDVCLSHARPDGWICSTVLDHFLNNGGMGATGENLAWSGGLESNISLWIDEGSPSEKTGYLAGDYTGATGHYQSLINPDFRYTGMASFNPTNDNLNYDWTCTAGEYSSTDEEVTELLPAQNVCVIQKMPIKVSYLSSLSITGPSILRQNDTADYKPVVTVTGGGLKQNRITGCPVYSGVTFSSSDTSVLEITEDGHAVAKGDGVATITAVFGGEGSSKTLQRQIAVGDGLTITGVENPDMITVESYKTPELPQSVKATLSGGGKLDVNVTWETYSASAVQTHFKSNEFEVSGTAEGLPVTQKVHVNAAVIRKIYTEPDTITTDYGALPELPKKVKIALSNGLAWSYNANWDDSYKEYCNQKEGGTFTITGYASPDVNTDEGWKRLTFSAELIVNPEKKASETSSGFPDQSSDVSKGTDGGGNGVKNSTGGKGTEEAVAVDDQNYDPANPTVLAKESLIQDPVKGFSYRVSVDNRKNPQVVFTAYSGKKTKVIVPDSVKVRGIAYKVTSIDPEAFAGKKKLRQVTIGKNVTVIGEKAFYDCGKLKTIIVKGSKLKKVGRQALKGVNGKCRIRALKKKLKAYQKLFKGKGQKKTVKVVKK